MADGNVIRVGRRKSITFVPSAYRALTEEATESGLSETDVVNRAVQVYRFVMESQRSGKKLKLEDGDGATETVHIV